MCTLGRYEAPPVIPPEESDEEPVGPAQPNNPTTSVDVNGPSQPGNPPADQLDANNAGDDAVDETVQEPAVSAPVRLECSVCFRDNSVVEFTLTDEGACGYCDTPFTDLNPAMCLNCHATHLYAQISSFNPAPTCSCRASTTNDDGTPAVATVPRLDAGMRALCAIVREIPPDSIDSNDPQPSQEPQPTPVDLPTQWAAYGEFTAYNVMVEFSENWRFCPNQNCLHPQYQVRFGTMVSEATNWRVTCTECNTEYCGNPVHEAQFEKRGVQHAAAVSCADVQPDNVDTLNTIQMLLENGSEPDGSRRGDTIRCPRGCGNIITKNGGCHQMVCGRNSDDTGRDNIPGCGHVFCFYCLQPWPTRMNNARGHRHGYSSCPQWTRDY